MKKSHFLACILLISGFQAIGQTQDSLDRIEVVTYTRYSPVLTSARKLTTVPVFETPEVKLPTFDYVLPEFRYTVTPTYRPAKAAEIQTDRSQEVNDNYFKLGGGNYLSGLAEIHLHNKQSEKYDFGGFARHFSSNASDPANADFSDNLLGIFGTKTTRKGALNGSLNYERHVVHYYAAADSLELTKRQTNQIFNDVNGKVGWQSNPSRRGLGFSTSLEGFGFSTLRQNEQDFRLNLNPFLEFRRAGRADLKAAVEYTALSFGDSSLNRFFVHIDPSYTFTVKKFDIHAGIQTVLAGTGSSSSFYVFPDIEVKHYIVPERMKAYLRLGGGLDKNQLRQLSYKNPFIADYVDIRNTINQFEFATGIKGALAKKVDYLIGVNYKTLSDLPLFLSDTTELRRFNTVYDKVGILSFQTGMGVRLNEKFFLQWAGHFYTYNTDAETNAWQLPDYDIDINLRYTLGKKLHMRFQSYIIGERYQFDHESGKAIKLKPVGDINLLTEYRYSKYLAFFLNVNNIGNARYQKWYAYPSYGINVLGGVSFSL